MNDQHNQNRANKAWNAARQWRDRARGGGNWHGPRLFLAWLVFGLLMMVGLVIAVVFLLLGWLLMPFLRHSVRKRTGHSRARARKEARDKGPGQVIEGEYRVDKQASPGSETSRHH